MNLCRLVDHFHRYIEILHNRIHQLEHFNRQTQTVASGAVASEFDNSLIEIESDSVGVHGQSSVLAPASYLEPRNSAILSPQTALLAETNLAKANSISTVQSRSTPQEKSTSLPPSVLHVNMQSNSPLISNANVGTESEYAGLQNSNMASSTCGTQHPEQSIIWSNTNLARQEGVTPRISTDSQTEVESAISALGAAASRDDDTPRSLPGFYGASSAISFFNEIQEALKKDSPNVDKQSPSARSLRSSQHGQDSSKLLDFNPKIRLQDFHLPPRILADYLLETYWDNVHCLYPLIHKSSFEAVYRQLWTSADNVVLPRSALDIGLGSSSCPTSIFYCALNAIFALGCNFSKLPSGEKRDLADTFCQRSLDLALGNLLDNSNLALVQALFILGQYLQSTEYPTRCWNVVGLALRVAQGIGLYVDRAYTNCSLLETEIKRRTWHACLLLDVYLFTVFLIL